MVSCGATSTRVGTPSIGTYAFISPKIKQQYVEIELSVASSKPHDLNEKEALSTTSDLRWS